MPLVHTKLVKLTAGVIRQTYIQERSLIDKKQYVPSSKWDGNAEAGIRSTWERIAEKLLLNGIEPELYVRYYFEHEAVVGGSIVAYYPTDLLSDKTINHYRLYGRETAELDMHDALEFQTECARTAFLKEKYLRKVDDRAATRSVLWNMEVELSPLFRFCWAASMKLKSFRSIRDHYLPLAAIQYSRDPDAYDKIWGDKIPANFRTYVTRNLGLTCKGRFT